MIFSYNWKQTANNRHFMKFILKPYQFHKKYTWSAGVYNDTTPSQRGTWRDYFVRGRVLPQTFRLTDHVSILLKKLPTGLIFFLTQTSLPTRFAKVCVKVSVNCPERCMKLNWSDEISWNWYIFFCHGLKLKFTYNTMATNLILSHI